MKNTRLHIYNASAGSGKTFQLTVNFLQKLLENPSNYFASRLIGLTFTNDAANEMKNRILKNLKNAANSNFDALIWQAAKQAKPTIEEQLKKKINPEELEIEIVKRSKQRLFEILHRYDDFNLLTLDKLSYRILRTFAREMNIPHDVNIIMDHKEVVDNLIDEIISEVQPNDILMKSLVELAKENADNEKAWDIKAGLMEIVQILFDENHYQYIKEIKKKKTEDFIHLRLELIKEMRKIKQRFLLFYQEGNFIIQEFKEVTAKEVIKRINSCKNPSDFKNIDFSPTMKKKILGEREAFFYVKSKLKKMSAEQKMMIEGAYNDKLTIFLTQLYEFYTQNYPNYVLLKGILEEINSLIIMNALNAKIEQFKEQTHSIFIHDFNFLIREQLLKDLKSDAPFIYMRLGEKFIHYFLDEFQDTSALQWENLLPLIKESLSKNFSSDFIKEMSGETMIVGDAKQSIYRFRNGKPEIFIDLSNPELQDESGNPFTEITNKTVVQMDYNWRSDGEIIRFNNDFFFENKTYLKEARYENVYHFVKQKVRPAQESDDVTNKGYVEIRFLKKITGNSEENVLPQQVLEIIQDVLSRGYSYKDICFLFPTHDASTPVAEFLTENNIPVISKRSLLVSKSIKVNFLVDIMKFITYENKMNLFNALLVLFKEKEISNAEDILLELLEISDFKAIFSKLNEWGFEIDYQLLPILNPYDLAVYLLDKFKWDMNKENAYIEAFLDELHQYTHQSGGGLPGFLLHWDEIKDTLSLASAETSEAVRLMTVHAAKGLEFPVVIYLAKQELISRQDQEKITWIPVAKDKFQGFGNLPVKIKSLSNNPNYQWHYQQAIEEKKFDNYNKLYVAHTRAIHELYILSPLPPKDRKENPPFAQLYEEFLNEHNKVNGKVSDGDIFSLGKKEEKYEKNQEKTEFLFKKIDPKLSYWGEQKKLKIRTRNFEYWSDAKKSAIKYGLEIHEILSKITTKKDWEKNKEKYLAKLNQENKQSVEKIIEKVMNHPKLKEYFSNTYQILNERALLIPKDESFEIKRPDRILLKSNKAIILDYKTGEIKNKHLEQLNNYAEILNETGYQVQAKHLVYISENIEVIDV